MPKATGAFLLRHSAALVVAVGFVWGGTPSPAQGVSAWRRAIETGQRLHYQAPSGQPSGVEEALLFPRGAGARLTAAADRVSDRVQAATVLLQAQWSLAAGNAEETSQYAARLIDTYPQSELHDHAQYVLAQAELKQGRVEAAERRMDWLSRHGSEPWRGWGLYGQGQAALARGDTVEALRVFRVATSLKDHEVTGPALLRLGQLHDVRGEAARAVRYLTLYREACPNGITPLLEHAVGESSRADAVAGVTYAVQVGVFGDAANAQRQKETFSALGYKTELKRKRLAGNSYTAVWVGRFRTRERALEVRRELEERFGETYRVVVYE